MLDRSLFVYVAGPFSHEDHWRRAMNVSVAASFIRPLLESDCVPFVPHTLWGQLWREVDEFSVMRACKQEIERHSDAMLLVTGWKSSRGSVQEFQLAEDLGVAWFEALTPGKLPEDFLAWRNSVLERMVIPIEPIRNRRIDP